MCWNGWGSKFIKRGEGRRQQYDGGGTKMTELQIWPKLKLELTLANSPVLIKYNEVIPVIIMVDAYKMYCKFKGLVTQYCKK